MDDPTNDGQFLAFFAPAAAGRHLQVDRRTVPAGVTFRPGAAGPATPLPARPTGTGEGSVESAGDQHRHPADPGGRGQQRLGLLTLLDGNAANDDAAGFPNGRRPDDDVTDISARAVAGILANPATFGTRIGDGVNVNDMPERQRSRSWRRPTTAATAATSIPTSRDARACARPGQCCHFHRRHDDEHLQTKFIVAAVTAGSATALSAQPRQPLSTAAEAMDSPAERKMAIAQKKIARDPKHYHGYNELALALTQRARGTRANPVYYQQAEEAVRTSLALAPDNFEALKVRTWALLGQHRFAAALELATTLNTKVPDDLMVYGMLTDANIELGKFRRGREVGPVDAQPAPRRHSGVDAGRLLARALWRHRGRAIELMQQAVVRMPFQEKPKTAPGCSPRSATSNWVEGSDRRRPSGGHRAGAQSVPELPLRAGGAGRSPDGAGPPPRGGGAAAAALRRGRRTPRTSTSWPRRGEARAGLTRPRPPRATPRSRPGGHEGRLEAEEDNANRELISYFVGAGKKPAGRVWRSPGRNRPPWRRLHARSLRVGALQERQAGRGPERDRRG